MPALPAPPPSPSPDTKPDSRAHQRRGHGLHSGGRGRPPGTGGCLWRARGSETATPVGLFARWQRRSRCSRRTATSSRHGPLSSRRPCPVAEGSRGPAVRRAGARGRPCSGLNWCGRPPARTLRTRGESSLCRVGGGGGAGNDAGPYPAAGCVPRPACIGPARYPAPGCGCRRPARIGTGTVTFSAADADLRYAV